MPPKPNYALYKYAMDFLSFLAESKNKLRDLEGGINGLVPSTDVSEGSGQTLPTSLLSPPRCLVAMKSAIIDGITNGHQSADALTVELERLRDGNYTATNYTRYHGIRLASKCVIS